jgi:type IX secretion system substrate protein/galactose oxidase-like protein
MKTISTLLILIFSILMINVNAKKEGDWNTLSPPNSPEARHGHSMVTLPDGRVMLFGGEGPQEDLFNDLFIYDNNDWVEITPHNDPPSPRRNHETWMAGDRMFVYGGLGELEPLNDMWYYDINENRWEENTLSGEQPPARYGHTITPVNDGSVLILGGKDSEGNKLKDFWRMNPDHSCVRLSDPPRLYYNHITHLVDNDIFFAFGKDNKTGVYQISASVWGEAEGGFPISEFNSYIVNNNLVIAFGGKGENGTLTNNVYTYNCTTGVLTTRTYPIPAKIENGGGAKYFGDTKNADDYQVLLFGGIIDGVISNTSYISTSNFLAIDENDYGAFYELSISPNPTNGPLMISANKNIDKILIYDINGRLVKELESNNPEVLFDLNSLNSGLFFIKIWIDHNHIKRKIIKK